MRLPQVYLYYVLSKSNTDNRVKFELIKDMNGDKVESLINTA